MKRFKKIALAGCYGLVIHDFIALCLGATLTWFGLITLGLVVLIGMSIEDSLEN